jgi:hypothetical protein
MAQAASTVAIFIYISVVCAILAVSVKHKQFRLKIYEEIIFCAALLFLVFLFVYHYYSLISTMIHGFVSSNTGEILGSILELTFVVTAISFCII